MYPPLKASEIDLPIAMGWRALLFANWPVEPDVVDAHLPRTLTLDTYDGEAWLSIVPFTNVDVRPRGLPPLLGRDLPELNLRTYVTYDGEEGVYFFSLDADGLPDVAGARLTHFLPYYYADISIDRSEGHVEFDSRRRQPGDRPCDFAATYEPVGDRFEAATDSREEFLTQRHRYYTETPGGQLRYATIEHRQWPLYEAEAAIEENRVFEANGFADPDADPLFLYSPGVDVVTSGSKPAERAD